MASLKRLIGFVAALLVAAHAIGAITIDGGPVGVTFSTSASAFTWSFTTGSGSNRILLVAYQSADSGGTAKTASGMTFNGVALSYITATASGGSPNARLEIWGLIGVSASTTANIVATLSGTQNNTQFGSVELAGTDPFSPYGASAINNQTSGTTSPLTITTTQSGSLVMDAVVARTGGGAPTITLDHQLTSWWNARPGSSFQQGAGGYFFPASIASYPLTDTFSGAVSDASQLALEVIPVQPTATPTDTATVTPTDTPTSTPTWTPTVTPTVTPTDSSTFTPSPTTTNTPNFTATPTATPSPTATNTPICENPGNTTPVGNNYLGDGLIYYKAVVFSSNETVYGINAYLPSGVGRIQSAVYTDRNGKPFSLLGSSSVETVSVDGWNTTFLSVPVTAGITYWAAFQVDNSLVIQYSIYGLDRFAYSPWQAWPSQAPDQNFGGTFSMNVLACH